MVAPQKRLAVTIVELLVVLGVTGVLISLVLPAVQSVRASASRAACQNNLKQIALALHAYHDQQGGLPPQTGPGSPNTSLRWLGFLLPYVEQEALWTATVQAFRIDPIAFHNPPHIGYATVVKLYTCPADGRLLVPLTDQFGVTAAYGSYVGIFGARSPDGVLGPEPGIRFAAVTDGMSQTVMLGERPPPDSLQAGRWYTGSGEYRWGTDRGPDGAMFVITAAWASDPQCIGPFYVFSYGRTDNPCDRYHLWSLHPGGANFAFTDGSARFLGYPASTILPALATRDGGEVVEIP